MRQGKVKLAMLLCQGIIGKVEAAAATRMAWGTLVATGRGMLAVGVAEVGQTACTGKLRSRRVGGHRKRRTAAACAGRGG